MGQIYSTFYSMYYSSIFGSIIIKTIRSIEFHRFHVMISLTTNYYINLLVD